MSLYPTTAQLLRDSNRPYSRVAKDLKISQRWVYMVANEEHKDPGVNKIEAVYTYLTGRDLKLVDAA